MVQIAADRRVHIDYPQVSGNGFYLKSKASHIIRKILSIVLAIFACFRRKYQLYKNDQRTMDSFFSFETFKAKINDIVVYIKKEDYLRWKHEWEPFIRDSFAQDLTRIIELEKQLKEQPRENVNS